MLLGLLLAGSLFGPQPAPGERTASYRCDGDLQIVATWEKRGTLLVQLEGGGYRLRNAGGATWSDGQGQSLVVGDGEALWTSGADGARKCALTD